MLIISELWYRHIYLIVLITVQGGFYKKYLK
jgi:hypothetical protein